MTTDDIPHEIALPYLIIELGKIKSEVFDLKKLDYDKLDCDRLRKLRVTCSNIASDTQEYIAKVEGDLKNIRRVHSDALNEIAELDEMLHPRRCE